MNILFIVPYVPNLIYVRPYNIIRHISKRGHKVTLLTLWNRQTEKDDLADIARYCSNAEAIYMSRWRSLWNSLLGVPTRRPLQSVYSWNPALGKRIREFLVRGKKAYQYDIVHVEHLRGSRYGLYVNGIDPKVPVVWDSVDCISALFRRASESSVKRSSRIITRFEVGRTERYEGWLLTQFDHALITSPSDKQAILSLVSSPDRICPITVLPNGVDLEYFQPNNSIRREPATLVISGKMSYHANISMVLHFVQTIMPILWAQNNNIKLWIVGKDPTQEILEIGKHPAITVTGTVPDIRPYLQKATVSITPLTYAAGIQNKVLEAMACETPVVTNPLAIKSLNCRSGSDVLVAQSPGDFVEQVLSLINNRDYQRQIGQAGRRFVETHHRWDSIAANLEGVYAEVIRSRTGGTN
jgi:sugar transferase (PEP-CTERM/EpsH1 system associated)